MIDIIGAISLTALFGLCAVVLITAVPVDAATRSRYAVAAVVWFAGVGVLAALGVFSASGVGTVAIGMAILIPLSLLLLAAARSSTVRRVALDTPLAVLVTIHAGRVLGVFFLLLLEAGRLPPTFALIAGWGDIGVAVAALPLAWAIQHRITGWRTLTFAWNLFGFADLITAVTLGVGSAPNSPARFIFESPDAGAAASLPWVIIPAVLVPLYLLSHLAIFAQLGRAIAERRHPRHGAGLVWESSGR
jgi:hypothetical protein